MSLEVLCQDRKPLAPLPEAFDAFDLHEQAAIFLSCLEESKASIKDEDLLQARFYARLSW